MAAVWGAFALAGSLHLFLCVQRSARLALLLELSEQPYAKIRVIDDSVDGAVRRIRAIPADGGDHLVRNPALEGLRLRLAGPEDEAV